MSSTSNQSIVAPSRLPSFRQTASSERESITGAHSLSLSYYYDPSLAGRIVSVRITTIAILTARPLRWG
jgi:hypothetical protein